MKRPLLAAAIWLFALSAFAEPVTYTLDPNHTQVLARWSHFGFSHPVANFGQADGTLVYDPEDVAASRVDVRLPLAGLETFVPDFDEHLKSADFFDAASYPDITFKSTRVEAAGDGKLKVTGDLTIKDTTRPVVLDVTLNRIGAGLDGRAKIGFDAVATVKRSDFDVSRYAPNVSDEVALRITTEAVVPKPEAAQ